MGMMARFQIKRVYILGTVNSLLGAKANGNRFIFTLIRKSMLVRGTMDAIMQICLGPSMHWQRARPPHIIISSFQYQAVTQT